MNRRQLLAGLLGQSTLLALTSNLTAMGANRKGEHYGTALLSRTLVEQLAGMTLGKLPSPLVPEFAAHVITLLVDPTYQNSPFDGEEILVIDGLILKALVEV